MTDELRRRGHTAMAASYNQSWMEHRTDIELDLASVGPVKKHFKLLRFAYDAVRSYDLFHFFWGQSLYGLRHRPHLDLPILHSLGKKIIVHFRGTDLVDLAYYDYLRSKNGRQRPPARSRADQQRSLDLWRRYADRLLVSTPDLLDLVPEAEIVPQAIDTNYWHRSVTKAKPDDIVRIVHAPSRRRTKGTEFVERSVEQLREQGYPVELVLIEGKPADEVKSICERCDIGIDQLLLGWHGKVSVELMALELPVVCHIDPRFRKTADGLPLVDADPDSLTDVLAGLVRDPDRRRRLGREGREYVARHHDVGRVVDRCLDIYSEVLCNERAHGRSG